MSLYSAQRILVIEDDAVLGEHIRTYLVAQGFEVTLCADGVQGLNIAQQYRFDVVLLDVLLPSLNGLEVLQQLHRAQGTPVILISALGEEQDRTTGFGYGADDYVPKPFSMSELTARINALLRRIQLERRLARELPPPQNEGPFYFSSKRKDVRYQQQWLELTETEFRLLRLFWHYREDVLDKRTLYQQVLNREYCNGDRGLDMHVSHIRRKLHLANCSEYNISTLRNQGYRLDRAFA